LNPALSLFLVGLGILVLTGNPAAKMKQDTDGGGGGAGGTSTGRISCTALRQQVTTAYARAGSNSGMAQAAGIRAEKECKDGRLVS
jgi:hypothetical protein